MVADEPPAIGEPLASLEPDEIEHIFCYGSLMRGESHHRLLIEGGDEPEALPTVVQGALWSFGAYPGLTLGGVGAGPVFGECYRVANLGARLAALDAYEGFDPTTPEASEFRRVGLAIRCSDGSQIRAWCYVVDDGFARAAAVERLEGGWWRARSGG